MIKTTVIPDNINFMLTMPSEYIGKKVEILYYSVEEIKNEQPKIVNQASKFKGILNNEEADKFDKYISSVRAEWNRDI